MWETVADPMIQCGLSECGLEFQLRAKMYCSEVHRKGLLNVSFGKAVEMNEPNL